MDTAIKFRILNRDETSNGRYKYELSETYVHQLHRAFPPTSLPKWISLRPGVMTISRLYRWDGPTGVVDTADWMQASLVHDALYQLMRERKLPMSCRVEADSEMRSILKASGMGWFRRNKYWLGVRLFARGAARPD